jgi:hypothetical protein
MADAQTVIRDLGQQVAQLTVDKAILAAELAEARERIADFEATYCTGEGVAVGAVAEGAAE